MKTTVETQEGNNVKLLVELEEAEFERALETAFKKIAREVHIPGFRPGKVPRRILEKRIGSDYARGQALQDSLPEFYVQALVENDVDAISSPELKLLSGEEDGPVSFEAVVEVRPTVRVPGYDGLQVTVASPLASEEEIEAQVDRMRGAFATLSIVDRQAHEGDNVTIDVAGTIDGEAVPGLTATDYLYEVGAGSVVPELDTNLVGASAGETISFEAPIPGVDEEGAMIQFVVTVKAVNEKVLPDADDEWAASASEFSTVDELRADIAKRMTLVKRVQANMALRDETVKALVELVDEEVPESLVNTEINRRLQDLAGRLAQQNATIEMYLQATNQTEQMLVDEARPGAIESVKADLALRAVAEAEAIEVADSDVDEEIENLARRFKMKPKKVRGNLEKSFQMSVLRADIRKAKALTFLTDHATVVDADGHVIERSLLEVQPEEFAEAGQSVEALGLDSDLDVHDHDDHEGHDHD